IYSPSQFIILSSYESIFIILSQHTPSKPQALLKTSHLLASTSTVGHPSQASSINLDIPSSLSANLPTIVPLKGDVEAALKQAADLSGQLTCNDADRPY